MKGLKEHLYNLATDRYQGFIPGLFKALLLVFSGIYGLLIKALIFFYSFNPKRLECKVISVGNITLGGTGKTSLVELIASYLKSQGQDIAVLSRGYKKPVQEIGQDSRSYQALGDEAYMLSLKLKNVPVMVDTDRLRAAVRAIKEFGAATVILDDGFQQWRIARDLDIITIDANNPFGNRRLIPRGILREPANSLKRADILVLTKVDSCRDTNLIKESLAKINPAALVVTALYQPLGFLKLGQDNIFLDQTAIKNKNVALVSGIADPAAFENTVKSLGANIGLSFKFADHHRYSQNDLDTLIAQAGSKNIDLFITTEKDAVKLKKFWPARLYPGVSFLVLRVKLKIIENEERFLGRLLGIYPD